jgi:AcrR family transcriptional regulator
MPAAAPTASQEQEALVLQAAVRCIEASSLLDFTMGALSREVGLSMGSIYKHIQSKEDVLVALGYYSRIHFEQLACRILALPLPIAARLVAVQLVNLCHTSPYSFGAQLTTLLGNEALLRRASAGWLERYLARDRAVEALFHKELMDAADSGELQVTGDAKATTVNEISTAIWSLCVGHAQVARQRNVRTFSEDHTQLDRDSAIVRTLQRLLNTYPWRTPVSDELLDATCQLLSAEGLR